MSPPTDPQLDQAARLLEELRERCAAPDLGSGAEELLIGGYASALALEGTRRRLRARALELSERELSFAARERELRGLLRTLQARMREPATSRDEAVSDDEPTPQRLH
ncbi:MAG TPA: hypothetical protein VKB25_12345 [Conexibacter sp.]|nr:hypothetical protein [Conexibacter sp.]